MGNEVYKLVGGTTFFAGATAGLGCIFAPASAAAVGPITVMSAFGLGAMIMAVPSLFLIALSIERFDRGGTFNQGLAVMGGLSFIAASIYFSAALGALFLGVAASPIFNCALAGLTAILAVGLTVTGAFVLLLSLVDQNFNQSCDF